MNERNERADDATTPPDGDDEPTVEPDRDENDAQPEAAAETEADAETEPETDTETEPDVRSLGVGVVTVATDRTIEKDAAGETIVTILKKDDHEIAIREHVDADLDQIQSVVSRLLDRDDVDLIVTGGATSVEPDDVTIEAVSPLLDKELAAFGDLFTTLAYEEVGTRVIAARTLAGVADGIPVFCLPGNEPAIRLGLERIVMPEIHHLIDLARATPGDADLEEEAEAGDDLETEMDSDLEEGAAANADTQANAADTEHETAADAALDATSNGDGDDGE